MAEIYNVNVRYWNGDLREIDPPSQWSDIWLCVTGLRRFFDLPKKTIMRNEGKVYIVSVHDRKKKYGLKVRVNPKDDERIQVESGDTWINPPMYYDTKRKMIELFIDYNKKYLYVVIEEE